MIDATTILLVVAAIIAATTVSRTEATNLNHELNNCKAEYQGFKKGVIYGK